jgi:hypothetical protein
MMHRENFTRLHRALCSALAKKPYGPAQRYPLPETWRPCIALKSDLIGNRIPDVFNDHFPSLN